MQVTWCIRASESDRAFPALTGLSGTQRVRHPPVTARTVQGMAPYPNVADTACLIGSRVRRGTPEPTFRSPVPLLCLVTSWPLLKRPHVAVGVTEI